MRGSEGIGTAARGWGWGRTLPSWIKLLMLAAITSLDLPLPRTNSRARPTSSRLNSAKLISGGGRCSVR